MVENSLQDYQAQAEDVKVSGEADLCILAGICWHIVTCVLCKAGKRTPSGPLFSTSNLQISHTCICLLVEELTLTTQLLIRVCSKFRPQWNRWQWHCHYLVQKRSKKASLKMEAYPISGRFCTFIFGWAFYSPTLPNGECGWYLEHGEYSAVGKREI